MPFVKTLSNTTSGASPEDMGLQASSLSSLFSPFRKEDFSLKRGVFKVLERSLMVFIIRNIECALIASILDMGDFCPRTRPQVVTPVCKISY